ncbi:hypothetical protein PTTG_26548 [Puccinia triticina 1-1 BBBD Race 1]|uniref:BAH domain-containing protein n=1 Tax=Puccinia triticina (isolate 1-1 / race 1 (BBBD)) TaxID=630390 RepID=A0A180GT16_PUCT1|nr:hypothetical protein PTTG_26548 [Puccinia triticina 1-1 BBBD Race 1]
MDYNDIGHIDDDEHFPQPVKSKLLQANKALVPGELARYLPGWQLIQLSAIRWTSHRVLKQGVFVLVRPADRSKGYKVGCIAHVWQAKKRSRVSFWVCYTEYERGNIDPYYQLRCIRRSGSNRFARIREIFKDLVLTLNVQHNCVAGGCELSATGRVCVEREESEENNATVAHKDADCFVVNSGELPRNKELVEWADVPRGEEHIQHLIPMLEGGLAAWLGAGGSVSNDKEAAEDD